MPNAGKTAGFAKIHVKRAQKEPSPTDGCRILVDRLWPRGLTKDRLRLSQWIKEIAPSHELRRWFGHDPQKWAEFKRKYFDELDANPVAVEAVISYLKKESTVTFVFGAKEEVHNNAVALQEYIQSLHRN